MSPSDLPGPSPQPADAMPARLPAAPADGRSGSGQSDFGRFDPWRHPEAFSAIRVKRVIAYAVDIVLVSVAAAIVWVAFGLLGIITFGLLLPLQALAVALVPIAYHTLFIASRQAATPGMRLMGLEVGQFPGMLNQVAGEFNPGDGRPTLFQAMILTVAFYVSGALTGGLILLVSLFNARGRTLHDWLAGTVVVNRSAGWRTVRY